MKLFKLQRFAAGENAGQAVRTYTKEFHGILASVYAKKAYWTDFFTQLQILDGIGKKDIAFTVKTNDAQAVINDGSLEAGGTPAYDTGANVAFGTGTSNSSRFGARTEAKYQDIDVPYTWDYAYDRGIDKHTVNEDFDVANANEMERISNGLTGLFNKHQGGYLTDNAGKTVAVNIASADTITSAQAIEIFNKIDAYLTDIEVDETLTRVAAVTPALYNAIVDNGLSTTAKGSDVNIDRNEVRMFKDFVIRKLPTKAFKAVAASGDDPATQDICIAGVAGIGIPFCGIETARVLTTVESFDGSALQGAGKCGEYVSVDNRKAIVKVTGTITGA